MTNPVALAGIVTVMVTGSSTLALVAVTFTLGINRMTSKVNVLEML